MIESRKLKVRTLASGTELSIRVYTVRGRNPHAKKAYIQSSMHGSEVQGNAVIAALLAHFAHTPPEGDVTLVPNANPYAIDQKCGEYTNGRFDPTTGTNWNRNYWLPHIGETRRPRWSELRRLAAAGITAAIRDRLAGNLSCAQHLALTLQSLAATADYVIDLHCANVSVRHLYAPEYAVQAARRFAIPLLLAIPNTFDGALDESVSCAWWTFWSGLQAEGYADLPPLDELPQGLTLELGGHEVVSRTEAERDAEGVLNFLRHRGVVGGSACEPEAGFVCALDNYRILYARHAGHADYTAVLGSVVKQGEQLAQTLQFADGPRWLPTLAEEDCIPILHHSSAVIHEGSELMKVFTRFRAV